MNHITNDNRPDLDTLPEFRKVATQRLQWIDEPTTIQTMEGELTIGPDLDEWEDGYWVCWPTDGTDPYPIAPSFVRTNMERIQPGEAQ